jgi:hypothetical protein
MEEINYFLVGVVFGLLLTAILVFCVITEDTLKKTDINGISLYQQQGGDRKYMECKLWNPLNY